MKLLFSLGLIFLLVSCTKKLSIEAYKEWFVENKSTLSQKFNHGDYSYELQYIPVEIVLLRNNKEATVEELKSKLIENQSYQYYNLKISSKSNSNFLKANLASKEEYYQRIAYYTTYAQSDIQLLDGTDTLSCMMYHFERNYGIQPHHTVLLGFTKSGDGVNDKTLLYNDQALGAKVRLKIKAEQLKKIPELIL